MMPIRCLSIATLPLLAVLTGCGGDPAPPAPPAKAEVVAHESHLLKLTLTTQAQQRLGIRTVRIGDGSAAQVRETSGEVVVPATGGAGVPTGSTSNLAQIGVSQVAAEGEVARA